MPNSAEDYVHRIGRTARAGASGSAISFLSAEETEVLRDIEKTLGSTIACEDLEGFRYAARHMPDPERTVARAGAGAGAGAAAGNRGGGSRRSGRRGGSGRAGRRS
jgi:ATP-dependent RNA helicase RhlE